MSLDLIYLAWNRRAYAEFSFPILLANTAWNRVNRLIVYDDGSTDGTDHWLSEQIVAWNTDGRHPPAEMHHTNFRSPVATMNHYLDHYESDMFAKIDSDICVPPGWLQEMARIMYLAPTLDILGMQADQGPPSMGKDPDRTIREASHIGGVGLIRARTFKFCRPVPRGRFGWTEHQQRHPDLSKAWITPDLPTFELDRLPFEPWTSLAVEYVDKGWQRAWGPYGDDANDYWDWAFEEEGD